MERVMLLLPTLYEAFVRLHLKDAYIINLLLSYFFLSEVLLQSKVVNNKAFCVNKMTAINFIGIS